LHDALDRHLGRQSEAAHAHVQMPLLEPQGERPHDEEPLGWVERRQREARVAGREGRELVGSEQVRELIRIQREEGELPERPHPELDQRHPIERHEGRWRLGACRQLCVQENDPARSPRCAEVHAALGLCSAHARGHPGGILGDDVHALEMMHCALGLGLRIILQHVIHALRAHREETLVLQCIGFVGRGDAVRRLGARDCGSHLEVRRALGRRSLSGREAQRLRERPVEQILELRGRAHVLHVFVVLRHLEVRVEEGQHDVRTEREGVLVGREQAERAWVAATPPQVHERLAMPVR